MINQMIGRIEGKNENKYLVLDEIDKNKEVLNKYEEVWEGIKKEIEKINGNENIEYGKDFKKIKFESNDDLPLNKPIKLRNVTIIIRSVFSENGNFYSQLFLDEALQYQKINISEEIDINKTNASKESELCHFWFFKDIGFKFKEHACNKSHDLLTIAYSFKDTGILNAKGATFRCSLIDISKNEGLKRLNNSVTYDKGVL